MPKKKPPPPLVKGHDIVKVGVAEQAMFCRCENKGTCIGCLIEESVLKMYGTQGLEYLRKFVSKKNGGEIRSYPDGLDEVCLFSPSFVHLEKMDTGHWWMGIDLADGGSVHVNFTSKGRIKANAHHERGLRPERRPDPPRPAGDPPRPL